MAGQRREVVSDFDAYRCGLLTSADRNVEATASERTPMQWHDGSGTQCFATISLGASKFLLSDFRGRD